MASLSQRERTVLKLLSATPGKTVKREDLWKQISQSPLRPGDRTVDVYVCCVRKKARVTIVSERNIGYRLEVNNAQR